MDTDSEFIHQLTIYYTYKNIDWWADQKWSTARLNTLDQCRTEIQRRKMMLNLTTLFWHQIENTATNKSYPGLGLLN